MSTQTITFKTWTNSKNQVRFKTSQPLPIDNINLRLLRRLLHKEMSTTPATGKLPESNKEFWNIEIPSFVFNHKKNTSKNKTIVNASNTAQIISIRERVNPKGVGISEGVPE